MDVPMPLSLVRSRTHEEALFAAVMDHTYDLVIFGSPQGERRGLSVETLSEKVSHLAHCPVWALTSSSSN
jgi:hypothetical protein